MSKHSLALVGTLCSTLGCSGAKSVSTQSKIEPVPAAVSAAPNNEDVSGGSAVPRINPPIWSSKNGVAADCDRHLNTAKQIRDRIRMSSDERTLENTLGPLNDLYIQLDTIGSLAHVAKQTYPQKEVREAAEQCILRIGRLTAEVELDRAIYDALAAIQQDSLAPLAKRFLDKTLRNYRLAGVNRDEQTRQELKQLISEMTQLEQEFSSNIIEGGRSFEVTKDQLEGVPDDFFKTHPVQKNGKIKIGTDRPTVGVIMRSAKRSSIRKRMMKLSLQRAYPENKPVLEKLLRLRFEYAQKLGYEDWASYNTAGKMADSKKTIYAFLDRLAEMARPVMVRERNAYLREKKKEEAGARRIFEWDQNYYRDKMVAAKLELDPQELRAYFEYDSVKKGILRLNEELFGLTFRKLDDAPVWHEDVEVYDVFESGELRGRFYLDMHPRSGKYDYAMEQPMIPGVRGRQLPVMVLICNFAKSTNKAPGLLSHNELKLFLHEFGHLMHELLASDHEWVRMSGINCERDFIEAPSQLLEEWAYDTEVLQRFAIHHKTGEVIPQSLVKKVRKLDEINKGMYVMRQLFYAAVSLELHVGDPRKGTLMDTVESEKRKYSPYPFEKDTYVYASFSHLGHYTSLCYTYMWTLVMAKDLFTKFKEAPSLLNREVALAYRRAVLEPGGTVDAAEMMKNFLGRPYSYDAFRAWLQK